MHRFFFMLPCKFEQKSINNIYKLLVALTCNIQRSFLVVSGTNSHVGIYHKLLPCATINYMYYHKP